MFQYYDNTHLSLLPIVCFTRKMCSRSKKKKKTIMMCIIVAKTRSICKFVLEYEINNYTRKSSIKLTPGESLA